MQSRQEMGCDQHPSILVGQLELTAGPDQLIDLHSSASARRYGRARLLVRHRGDPVGMMTVGLSSGRLDVEAALTEANHRFAQAIEARCAAQRPTVEHRPTSVVIATRNRPDHAVTCVQHVLRQRYPAPFEIIVVDNGATSDDTEAAIQAQFSDEPRVRYLRDPRKGLSRARNIGLAAARFPVTAFLSDDIQVDELWLEGVALGFARDARVRCVVGLCPPAYLDTEEQLVFEQAMGWGWRSGFEPSLAEASRPGDPLFPYRIGIGNGANMSFETSYFRHAGGFDEILGPGTPARGGEDLDAPVRVLLAGYEVAFEPSALGWHADRYDDRSFTSHMYTYGMGLTAFLARHAIDRTCRRTLLRRLPRGALYLLTMPRGRPESTDPGVLLVMPSMRWRHVAANLAGRLVGPVAVARSYWVRHREG